MTTQMLDYWHPTLRGPGSLQEGPGCRRETLRGGYLFLARIDVSWRDDEPDSAIIKPKLADMPDRERRGKVIIGTVEGDIHDIGKNIVSFMLDVNGFEVLDLGVDVPPQKFVDEIQSFQPPVVALSGFLTLSFDAMRNTVAAIELPACGVT